MNKRMKEILASIQTLKTEANALKTEKKFDDAKAKIAEIAELEKEFEVEKALYEDEKALVPEVIKLTEKAKTQSELERESFKAFIVSGVTMKAGEQNLNATNGASVIPTSIAQDIISAIKEVCPIYAKAKIYNSKGTLKIPVWTDANTSHNITVAYATEFTDLTADSGKFTSVDLTGYLVGALTLVGVSEINNADIDIVDFVVREMAKRISWFIEKELLVGTSGKCTGALSSTNTVTTASATAIVADELIDLQASIKTAYQMNACWVLNPATFTAIKKLKDSTGQYLLQSDYSSEFPYRLLGKPVYLSDNMPTVSASAKTVLYGDLSGLAVNMRENISTTVLREKYATQHAIGINAWFEMDSNVVDNQKLAVLVQKSS